MTEPDWTKLEEDIENERRERERKLDEAIRLRHEQILLENFYASML